MKNLSYKELKRRYTEEKKALPQDNFREEFVKALENNNEAKARNFFAILKKRSDSKSLAKKLIKDNYWQDLIKGGKMDCNYIIEEMKDLLDKPSATIKKAVLNKVADNKEGVSK